MLGWLAGIAFWKACVYNNSQVTTEPRSYSSRDLHPKWSDWLLIKLLNHPNDPIGWAADQFCYFCTHSCSIRRTPALQTLIKYYIRLTSLKLNTQEAALSDLCRCSCRCSSQHINSWSHKKIKQNLSFKHVHAYHSLLIWQKVHIPDPNKLAQSLHMIVEKRQTPCV